MYIYSLFYRAIKLKIKTTRRRTLQYILQRWQQYSKKKYYCRISFIERLQQLRRRQLLLPVRLFHMF